MTILIGLRLERLGVMPVAVLDLTTPLAIFRAEVIAQDGEQPGRHVRTGLEGIDIGERTQQSLLHQIVCAVDISTKGHGECAETWHRSENGFADRLVHGHYCGSFFPLPSRRLIRSLNRSGTPWLTTSSYMARSCWPRRACTSRPSLAGFALTFLLRAAVASIGSCCPTGLRSFIVRPQLPRPGRAPAIPLVLSKPLRWRMVPHERNFFAAAALRRYRLIGRWGHDPRSTARRLILEGILSTSQAVAQHLPYLRRYARALSGSQASGDAYVAATLEALILEPKSLESLPNKRVALYRLFTKIWNSVTLNGKAEGAVTSPGLAPEQHITQIT